MQYNHRTTQSNRGGSISGVATEVSGTPVPGLTVLAQPPGDPGTSISTRTDVNGRFRLAAGFGKCFVLTMDEQGNFSDCRLNLFSCFPAMFLSLNSVLIRHLVGCPRYFFAPAPRL